MLAKEKVVRSKTVELQDPLVHTKLSASYHPKRGKEAQELGGVSFSSGGIRSNDG